MEYMGYSIYEHYKEPSEELIVKDAENVIKYLNDIMKIENKDIILMGRSIGTGVACQLSKKYQFCTTVKIFSLKKLKIDFNFSFQISPWSRQINVPNGGKLGRDYHNRQIWFIFSDQWNWIPYPFFARIKGWNRTKGTLEGSLL